jgi:hypothetical protein
VHGSRGAGRDANEARLPHERSDHERCPAGSAGGLRALHVRERRQLAPDRSERRVVKNVSATVDSRRSRLRMADRVERDALLRRVAAAEEEARAARRDAEAATSGLAGMQAQYDVLAAHLSRAIDLLNHVTVDHNGLGRRLDDLTRDVAHLGAARASPPRTERELLPALPATLPSIIEISDFARHRATA